MRRASIYRLELRGVPNLRDGVRTRVERLANEPQAFVAARGEIEVEFVQLMRRFNSLSISPRKSSVFR